MKRNINPRETFAWIILFCAAFLFSITIAFAQDKSKERKGSTTIKIIKKEDGKTTKIDTTIDVTDDAALEKILNELGEGNRASFNFNFPDADGDHDWKKHSGGMTEEERKELKEELGNVDKQMKELHHRMKDIHINIHSDKDGKDSEDYSYSFEIPPVPPIPPMPGESDAGFFDKQHWMEKMHRMDFFFDDLDTLNDDEHAIIMGDENEQPPVFEKEVKGKHGEKIFIYKRSQTERSKANEEQEEKTDEFKLFPNPNDGKFSLNFHTDKKNDLNIKVYNSQGKEVYSETMKDFSGDYSNKLDLSGKGKGHYILKLTQGEKTITEKFVIE